MKYALGKRNKLRVVREAPPGLYLDDGEESEILLPGRYISPGTVPGDAWSDYLPASKNIEADWVTLKCGNYDKTTKKCSGQNYK